MPERIYNLLFLCRATAAWQRQSWTAHIEDPAEFEGTHLEKEAAFMAAFYYLENWIAAFTSLPLDSIDGFSLGTRLGNTGRLAGATFHQGKVG